MAKDAGKKANIEIVKKPEYANMIINDIQMHGTLCRKPKKWYPELLYNSEKHQAARIFTQMPNMRMGMSPTFGLVIELKFPLGKENAEAYKNAANSGKKFKIFIPKNGVIKILFDKNLKEVIRAHNRRVGFKEFKIMEGYGKLLSLDINNGTLIIKLAVRS